jgi:hypothetical protein
VLEWEWEWEWGQVGVMRSDVSDKLS